MRIAAWMIIAVFFVQSAGAQQPPTGPAATPSESSASTTRQASPEAASQGMKIESVWDFVVKGGPLMIPIGICSLIALTVIVERLISLRRRHVIPPKFFSGLTRLLSESNDRGKALDYCKDHPSPAANILTAGLKRLGEPISELEKRIEEAGEREVVKLRKNLRILSVIAAISPLLGLLGTIFGMITAFQTVAASAEALGKTELLAKGIYEAMITTAAGLMVAIPVLIAYHGLSAKVDLLVHELDRSIVDLLEAVAPPEARPAGAARFEPVSSPGVARVEPALPVGRRAEPVVTTASPDRDGKDSGSGAVALAAGQS